MAGGGSVAETRSAEGVGLAVAGWLPIKLQASDARSNMNNIESPKNFLLFIVFSGAMALCPMKESYFYLEFRL